MSEPKLPCDLVLKHVSKIYLEKDKPIMLDYWTLSCAKTVVIGEVNYVSTSQVVVNFTTAFSGYAYLT